MPKPKEPKLTKKQLRKLEKERKLAEEKKRQEEIERQMEEERRRRQEEFERRQAEEQKYRQEEKVRLTSEEKDYVAFWINLKTDRQRVIKAFREEIEWKNYLSCEEKFKVERLQDLNLLITLLSEATVNSSTSLESLLVLIDEAFDVMKMIDLRLLDSLGSDELGQTGTMIDFKLKIFKTIETKISEVHAFVLHTTENLVERRLEEIRKGQGESGKTQKASDFKPEIQLSYKKKHFSLGYWIMAFENSGIRPTPIDFREMGIMSDVPKSFFSKKLIMYTTRFNSNLLNFHDFFSKPLALTNASIISNSRYWPVNGFFEVGCFACLPPTKDLGDIMAKRVFRPKESLQRLSLPMVDGTGSNFKVYFEPRAEAMLESKTPFSTLLFEESKEVWTRENVIGVSKEYNQEIQSFQISSSVPSMAPFVVTQPVEANFPFSGFRIRRSGRGVISLNISTQMIDLGFEVTPGLIRLVSSSHAELSFLEDKNLSPQAMLLALTEANVLLIPRIHDVFRGSFKSSIEEPVIEPVLTEMEPPTPVAGEEVPVEEAKVDEGSVLSGRNVIERGFKNLALDPFLLEEVCQHAMNFHIKLSKFNNISGRHNVVLCFKENPLMQEEFVSEIAESWKTMLFSVNKCEMLKINEDFITFSFERVPNTVSHFNLRLLVSAYRELFDANALQESFSDEELLLCHTISCFLKPMNLFSYSG